MTVINPNDETLTINYFNRYNLTPVSIDFYNESTRVTTNKEVLSVSSGAYYNYLSVSNDDYFKDNNSYVMSIKNIDGVIVYKDKLYATTQEVDSYSINADVYTTNDTNTEYTIYE